MLERLPDQREVPRAALGRLAKAIRALSLANLIVVAAATLVLWMVSERTWWGTLFTFLPRHVFVVGPVLLLALSLVVDRRSILVNLVGLALVYGPLMGGQLSCGLNRGPGESEMAIKLVSCNVQAFEPDFASVLDEIASLSPDVVAFQEAFGESDLLKRSFPGWHILHDDQYWIGSRYPLRRVDLCQTGVFTHPSALTVLIDAPQRQFLLHDLHLTTPRYGFRKLAWRSVLDGSGPRVVEWYTNRRLAEALATRHYVDAIDAKGDPHGSLPAVVVGDFNTPSMSTLYRAAWPEFMNAFNQAGFGFGYTAPCTNQEFWFNDVPWVRIDHILADHHWSVSACGVGSGKGSDHRLIWALLSPRS